MIPKGKLLALLMIFMAVGGIAATGAFTTVEAERTADVTVDGDANALLGIQPNNQDTNDFVQQSDTNDQQLEIDLSNGDANSLNANAATNEENIITITNNGENTVSFFIATEGGLQDGSVGADGNEGPAADSTNDVSDSVNVEFYVDDGKLAETASPGDVTADTSNDNPVTLASEVSSDLDTFVDGDESIGSTTSDTDFSISHEGDRQASTGNDASGVELEPGEAVEISIYIEIDDPDDSIDLSSSDLSILENIVIIASEDVDSDLQIAN